MYESIDYLVEASQRSRRLCIALHLGGYRELSEEADALNAKIATLLAGIPIEGWETNREGKTNGN